MTSITAVPLRPIKKGSVTKLWMALGALSLVGAGLAWAGTKGTSGSAAAYLNHNAKQAGVITTETGLQYKIVKEGQGPSPTPADVTLVAYKGTLVDGKVFDQNERAVMPVDGVVPGFSEALQKMKRGGVYQLWIPPALAYGDKVPEGGPIPPNSVLLFEVHLLDFKTKAEIEAMQQEMQKMRMEGGLPAGAGGQMPEMPGQPAQ